MRTRTWRDRGIAWGLMLAWHGLLAWTLLRSPGIDHARNDDHALQVVWITAPAPAATAGAQPPTIARLQRQRRDTPAQPDKPVPIDAAPRAPAAAPSADPQPLSATFLEQVHALAQRQAPIDFGSRDPLASRPTQLLAQARDVFACNRSDHPGTWWQRWVAICSHPRVMSPTRARATARTSAT